MTEGGDFDNGCGGDSFNLINIPRHRSPSNSFTSDDEHRNFPGNTSMGRAASTGPSQTASQRKSSASLARTPSTAHSTGGHSFRPHENPFAATLNTVEEEKYECSDSSDDELVEIKHVIPDIKTDNITAYANETGDEGERNGQGHKRRGLRHYARKKSSSSSRVNRVITWARQWVLRFIQFSLLTRCFFYWVPLAIILFVPLAVGAWAYPQARLGEARLMWIFVWLEIVWGSLWISRIVAASFPSIYKFLTSIVAPGMKKYKSVLEALQLPISLVIWALISLCTFLPVMTVSTPDGSKLWQRVIQNILVALLISSLMFLGERLVIHLISVSFHKTRFSNRIKENKQAIKMISDLLYVACIPFPPFCPEFSDEDLQLQSGKFMSLGGRNKKLAEFDGGAANGNNGIGNISNKIASSHNLQRLVGKVNHAVDFAASTIGKVARGQALDSDDVRIWVNSVVSSAMSSKYIAEVLARRIWMSLVLEGSDSLTVGDLVEVLGEERRKDCETVFRLLDLDGNGDLTLEEMCSAVVEIRHEHKAIYNSLKDVDSAIKKLHSVLLFVILIIIIVIFIGMLAPSASAVLATLGSTILAMSFVFSVTAQEILASCVFLFVKHPLDVGDRVDINGDSFFVKEISLLFTVFTRTGDNTIVQAPNSVLNTLWIDNLSRSGPQCFAIKLYVGLPDTSLAQIQAFKERVNQFVLDNPKDYFENPFISCTDLPDLDRVCLYLSVTFTNNFSDGGMFSTRRNQLIEFVGRLINDLGLRVPRREDTSATDPGLPLNIAGMSAEIGGIGVDNAETSEDKPHSTGKRPVRGLMGFAPDAPEPVFTETGVDHSAPGAGQQSQAASAHGYTTGSMFSGVSRSFTTGRRRNI